MSASEHLSEHQFKAYRGLYLGQLHTSTFIPAGVSKVSGIGHHEFHPTDPNDDQAIIQNHLRSLSAEQQDNPNRHKWNPYGEHWTPHEHTAIGFAHDPHHGKWADVRSSTRPTYGLVLEAHTSEPTTRSSLSWYESQVNVPRNTVQSITAHLSHHPGGRGVRPERLRSFEVPKSHWRHP